MSDTPQEQFQSVVDRVIAKAVKDGIHTPGRVLLLLTEIDKNSRYGYGDKDISFPHSVDGQLIMPFGLDRQGRQQFLISFDPSECDDKSYPDPAVPTGWDWGFFKKSELQKEPREITNSTIGSDLVDPSTD